MKTRVGITGAGGRLAPVIARHLADRGFEMRLFSRAGGRGMEPTGTLTDPKVMAKLDALLHFGWSTVPAVAEQDQGREDREDIPFLRALLDTLGHVESTPHFVFASTAAVYGETGDLPATESSPCKPIGRYAAAKLRAEEMIRAAAAAPPALRCISLRISNVYGYADNKGRQQGIIPILVDALRNGKPANIWGDGSATRDYVHVHDLAEALVHIITQRLTGTCNVASGASVSVNEILGLIEKVMGEPVPVIHAAPLEWDVRHSRISSGHLQQTTPWNPSRAFHETARRFLSELPRDETTITPQ